MSGIYLHIPFCKQACYYCDFHFSTQLKNQDALIEALCCEIASRKDYLKDQVINTVYLGGGTPSIIKDDHLKKLFYSIQKHFKLNDDPEITLEANPDDITAGKLRHWKNLGVNRLSIGIQSFRDKDLNYMNRAHSASESASSVLLAKENGFDNISIDLIYGIPGLNMTAWKKNLMEAIQLGVQHISAYCLTIEPNTVFGHRLKKGMLEIAPDVEIEMQFNEMKVSLHSAGFDHYEVSNFALPGFISTHNSNYWTGVSYLGIGPSAHSFNSVSRRWNVSNNSRYIHAMKSGDVYFESEDISPQMAYNEHMLTGLRTKWGIDLDYVRDHFKINVLTEFEKELEWHSSHLSLNQNHLKLTESGLLLADRIASDLFLA